MNRLRIVVLGYVVRGPIGGMTWHHIQYLLGLRELGHDVLFIEDSGDYPSCYDPVRHLVDTDPTYGLAYAANVFERVGFSDSWAYHDVHTATWFGPASARAVAFCMTADAIINLSGVNPLREWGARVPVRIFVDTDPAFTQVRHLTNSHAKAVAAAHNVFFTFGEGIPGGSASVPDDGFPWRATRQPIFLDSWATTTPPANGRYTTVMQWKSYKAVRYQNTIYQSKEASFPEYQDLPQLVGVPLEIALGSDNAPRDELAEKGWVITDPTGISRTPWTYQNYIQNSRGEFSIAKQGFVVSRSGWFSERSACYLASGRPVVTQDTGFSSWLPTGAGLLAFRDRDGAIAALKEVESNYEHHAASTRAIVAEHFDSSEILAKLLSEASDHH